jgi:hypothetical protein
MTREPYRDGGFRSNAVVKGGTEIWCDRDEFDFDDQDRNPGFKYVAQLPKNDRGNTLYSFQSHT